jgi:hypothetical protein
LNVEEEEEEEEEFNNRLIIEDEGRRRKRRRRRRSRIIIVFLILIVFRNKFKTSLCVVNSMIFMLKKLDSIFSIKISVLSILVIKKIYDNNEIINFKVI